MGNWEYEAIHDDSEIKLTRYTGNASVVITPEQIDGLPVTVLGNRTFLNNSTITSVCLHRNIRAVEDGSGIRGTGAFRGCANLGTVILSPRMERIADYMFYGAASQRTSPLQIEFRNIREIGAFAFACCNHITPLHLPETVEKIDTGAFYQARRLRELHLPGVLEIAADAFTETVYEEQYEKQWEAGKFSGIAYAGNVAYLYFGKLDEPVVELHYGTRGISEFLFRNHYCRNFIHKLKAISIPETVCYIPPIYLTDSCKWKFTVYLTPIQSSMPHNTIISNSSP